jgi:hypothetical protein
MTGSQTIVLVGLALAGLATLTGAAAPTVRPRLVIVGLLLVGAITLFVLIFIVPWYWYLLVVGAGLAVEGIDRVTKRLAGEDYAATRQDEAEGPTATAT